MYQKLEKVPIKKIIEIVILIVILLWALLFIINYMRYTSDKPPIFAIHSRNECDDGYVDSYVSFGYVYRFYNSTSLTKQEFVPFWKLRERCEKSNGLPKAAQDFNIPENRERKSNYRGLVYFYEQRRSLLGAYKCLNSDTGCSLAISGYDSYDIKYKDPIYEKDYPEIGPLYQKYGFVDDSMKQEKEYGDIQYDRTIYYYDIEKKEILAEFKDIKFSTYTDKKYYGTGDTKNRFIVKDTQNKKWGLVLFKEDGTYENVLDFKYDSINYDEDTGYYILLLDNVWSIYDIDNDKILIDNVNKVIYDVWVNNNRSYYYKVGYQSSYNGEDVVNYSILKFDGSVFLDKKNVTNVLETKHLVIYLSRDDSSLHFIDYTGIDQEEPVKLNFIDFTKEKLKHPSFEYTVNEEGIIVKLKVYDSRDYKSEYKSVYVNANEWRRR